MQILDNIDQECIPAYMIYTWFTAYDIHMVHRSQYLAVDKTNKYKEIDKIPHYQLVSRWQNWDLFYQSYASRSYEFFFP